jgi:hypothetical protein
VYGCTCRHRRKNRYHLARPEAVLRGATAGQIGASMLCTLPGLALSPLLPQKEEGCVCVFALSSGLRPCESMTEPHFSRRRRHPEPASWDQTIPTEVARVRHSTGRRRRPVHLPLGRLLQRHPKFWLHRPTSIQYLSGKAARLEQRLGLASAAPGASVKHHRPIWKLHLRH